MKSITIFVLLIAFFSMELSAQTPIRVDEDSLKLGKAVMPALTVTIPEVNYKETLKAWTKELQSGTKSKIVTDGNNLSIFGARIKEINPNPINVYSSMTTRDSMVMLTVAFEEKKDQYVERKSSETEFNNAKNYLKGFAKNEYLDVAKDQADAEDKKLHDLQKQLSSFERDKARLQKTIESANTTISSEQQNLAVQQNELTAVSNEIVDQNKLLSAPEADAVKKEKTDYVSGLEKRKKKAQSAIETSQDRINKANGEIDKANQEIPKNERAQTDLSEKIENQQAVVARYNNKVKTIKSY